MKTLAFLFALILSAIGPAHARIGETLEECQARYGSATEHSKSEGISLFKKSGYIVTCMVTYGKVSVIVFNKEKQRESVFNPPLSDEEISTLQKANSGGSEWEETTGQFEHSKRTWKSKDGKLISIYDTVKNTMSFMTMEVIQKTLQSTKDKDQEKLKDF